MAKQTSRFKIKGTLDNITFYKSKDGNIAKMKTSLDGERIKNDPSFVRTRENGVEFGSSATSGKLMRDTLRNITVNSVDNRIVSRITQVMSTSKKLDATSIRGARIVGVAIAGAPAKALLKGLEFNKQALLGSILFKNKIKKINLNDRIFAPIPKFFKKLRNLGLIFSLEFEISTVVTFFIDLDTLDKYVHFHHHQELPKF